MLGSVAFLGLPPRAAAAAPGAASPPPPIIVAPGGDGGTVGIDVHSPGSPGGGGSGARNAGVGPSVDPCGVNPIGSACAAFDHGRYCGTWAQTFMAAGLPSTGLGPLLQRIGCTLADVGPTAAILAQEAYGLLRLPAPTIARSPRADNDDHGTPYTWVNLWTWFWTDPATFTPTSRTVSARTISATATATPIALVFDPGNQDQPLACAGPGRAWTPADGEGPPTNGGCAYTYRHVAARVVSTVSIQWNVTWTGSNGESGRLPTLVTTAQAAFAVEQVQAVTR
jgi:hypothetical protein